MQQIVPPPTSFKDHIFSDTHRPKAADLSMAASLGDLDAMRFLIQKKRCPYDWGLIDAAFRNGCVRNLEWLMSYFMSLDPPVSFVETIHDYVVDENSFAVAVLLGDTKSLTVLLYHMQCPYDGRLWDAAERNGDAAVMTWLMDNLIGE